MGGFFVVAVLFLISLHNISSFCPLSIATRYAQYHRLTAGISTGKVSRLNEKPGEKFKPWRGGFQQREINRGGAG